MYLMVGLPAAGKTTAARRLARETGSLRLSPDEWMLPLFGTSDADGKRDLVESRLIATALDVLQLGVSVILDFGFWSREERSSLRWIAGEVGADGRVVYLPVDPATQAARIEERHRLTPARAFETSPTELEAWRALFEAPDDDELSGAAVEASPTGLSSWTEYLSVRWPGCTA
jgi:predicted kinase